MTFKPGDILTTKPPWNKTSLPRYQVVKDTNKAYAGHYAIRGNQEIGVTDITEGMHQTVKFHGGNVWYFAYAFELVPEDKRDEALSYMVERAMEPK